jgi:hypothetical protein
MFSLHANPARFYEFGFFFVFRIFVVFIFRLKAQHTKETRNIRKHSCGSSKANENVHFSSFLMSRKLNQKLKLLLFRHANVNERQLRMPTEAFSCVWVQSVSHRGGSLI